MNSNYQAGTRGLEYAASKGVAVVIMELLLEGDFHREKGQTAECIQCRECAEKCPQSISISEWMPVVHQVLGEGKSCDEVSLP